MKTEMQGRVGGNPSSEPRADGAEGKGSDPPPARLSSPVQGTGETSLGISGVPGERTPIHPPPPLPPQSPLDPSRPQSQDSRGGEDPGSAPRGGDTPTPQLAPLRCPGPARPLTAITAASSCPAGFRAKPDPRGRQKRAKPHE